MPLLTADLSFPEGPVVLDDGSLVFTEITAGRLRRWDAGEVSPYAVTGGGPNGATLGADGSVWVTQNGGMGADPEAQPLDMRRPASVQRVTDGVAEVVITEAGGLALGSPNDLAFGPDGRLYFTDPNGPSTGANTGSGRIFALEPTSGATELLADVGRVYPNGIAFGPSGDLIYTESFTRRVMTLQKGSAGYTAEEICVLPERHFPDGFAVATDGTLAVAATRSGGVDIVSAGGELLEHLPVAEKGMVTNCAFAGDRLFVTESRFGGLYELQTGLTGLPLLRGR